MSSLNNNKLSAIISRISDTLLAEPHHTVCTGEKQLSSPSTEAAAIEILIKRLAEFHLRVTTLLFHNDKNSLLVELIRLNAVCSAGS